MLTIPIGNTRSSKSRAEESLSPGLPQVAPVAVAPLLKKLRHKHHAVRLDCLPVWLSNGSTNTVFQEKSE